MHDFRMWRGNSKKCAKSSVRHALAFSKFVGYRELFVGYPALRFEMLAVTNTDFPPELQGLHFCPQARITNWRWVNAVKRCVQFSLSDGLVHLVEVGTGNWAGSKSLHHTALYSIINYKDYLLGLTGNYSDGSSINSGGELTSPALVLLKKSQWASRQPIECICCV